MNREQEAAVLAFIAYLRGSSEPIEALRLAADYQRCREDTSEDCSERAEYDPFSREVTRNICSCSSCLAWAQVQFLINRLDMLCRRFGKVDTPDQSG